MTMLSTSTRSESAHSVSGAAALANPRTHWWGHPALIAAMAVVGIVAGGVTLMLATQYFPSIDG